MTDRSLVLPFLPVHSRGGPYDDEAYAAGWELGMLDTRLAQGGHDQVVATILSANAEQADLLGMRHGYLTVVTPTDVEGWHLAVFTPCATGDVHGG